MTSSSDIDIVQQVIEAVGALDVDAALELVADDLLLELPFRGDGGPRRLEGDAARAFIAAMPKLFSQLPFVDVAIHGALPSGRIVAEYRTDGVTHQGRPYANAYVAFFDVQDGRVTKWREYFDPNVVAAAFPVG